jgi:hypothetical protein
MEAFAQQLSNPTGFPSAQTKQMMGMVWNLGFPKGLEVIDYLEVFLLFSLFFSYS